MHLSHLDLTDFRGYHHLSVNLNPGVTAFVGKNGQGKTNLIEAVGYLSTLGSHRVSQDAPLVRSGQDRAVVHATIATGERLTTLDLEIIPGRANRAKRNGCALPRARDLLGQLRTVLFAPEDLILIKGDPAARRRMTDDLLVMLSPRYAGVRADYDKVIKQRSSLLKQAGPLRRPGIRRDTAATPSTPDPTVESTWAVWADPMVRFGADLLAARLYLLQRLAPHISRAYAMVSDKDSPATVAYLTSLPLDPHMVLGPDAPLPSREELATLLRTQLQEQRQAEFARGVCLVGPHRDDVLFELSAMPARTHASHGEAWSFALALRLASFWLARDEGLGEMVEREPVLILDDVFAELDSARRSRLATAVADAEQVLVTAAVPEDIPGELRGDRLSIDKNQLVVQNQSSPSCG